MSGMKGVEKFGKEYFILNAAFDKKSFAIVCADDEVVSAPKCLLSKCPFFENLFNSEPDQQSFKTCAAWAVFKTLVEFLRGNVPHPENAFDFVKLGLEVQLPTFIAACSLNAQTFSIPAEENFTSAVRISGAFVACLPLRELEYYDVIFEEAQEKFPDQEDLYAAVVLNELRRKDDQPFQLLSIPLFEKELTVAIMQLTANGITEMAVFVEGDWQPISLLNGTVDLQQVQITNFHLVFGKYFIYTTGPTRTLYVKDLLNDDPPEMFFESTKIFRSHFGYLLVVATENDIDTVFVWSDAQKNFKKIFSNSAVKVRNVSCSRVGDCRILYVWIVTENDQLIGVDQRGQCPFFGKCEETKIKDYVNDLWLVNENNNYTLWKDESSFLQIRDVTHIGFANISVEIVDREIGFYRTHTVNPESKSTFFHGRVHAICDVYLGVDHVDLD